MITMMEMPMIDDNCDTFLLGTSLETALGATNLVQLFMLRNIPQRGQLNRACCPFRWPPWGPPWGPPGGLWRLFEGSSYDNIYFQT
ncbi:hypothetical protein N9L68_00020 [bacterium]|nr:hypothetical protein [bacterium]